MIFWNNGHKQTRANSRLERVLRSGNFAVTVELAPPDSADPQAIYERALVFAETVDAINVTDASGAHCHTSSMAVCALLVQAGYEPVLQISCRDRNRIAMQGDLLGASVLGIRNVFCVTGDGVQTGDHPGAKPVFDLDSIQLLQTAHLMRQHGTFLSGRKLETPPKLFLGGAANPFVPPFEQRVLRLAKKVQAGADFIQTQYCFDVPRLKRFMQRVRDMGLHEQVYILVGVGPLRSASSAEWMQANVPGINIPDEIIDQLRQTPANKRQDEGLKMCVDIIEQVKAIEGVAGIHIMAYKQEELVSEIIERSGLLPRHHRTVDSEVIA
jgi:methylenetetrahydrofolate reductase (NADPH)